MVSGAIQGMEYLHTLHLGLVVIEKGAFDRARLRSTNFMEIMGRSGVFGLWILGKPFCVGIHSFNTTLQSPHYMAYPKSTNQTPLYYSLSTALPLTMYTYIHIYSGERERESKRERVTMFFSF